ncbi:MAG: glycerol dehydrogenase [Methanomassiliicoccaceae archaeon]|jgi:RPA family protein|nr:glycerol dehydrogenase [Methanomassiliicoccaceae archaeon]
MILRETAWRVFAGEMNLSTLERKGDDEKAPTYLITPLGTRLSRVLVAGVLLDKENIGSPEDPLWRARMEDVSGSYFINVGRYQPEAATAMASLETPSFVAVIGKIRTYRPDDTRMYVSIRPERIMKIDAETRQRIVLETAQATWGRLNNVKLALSMPDASIDDLVTKGMTREEAEGVTEAIGFYGTPESTRYLKLIQSSLRMLLPDKEIDLGLPEDVSDMPDEIVIDEKTTAGDVDKEDLVLNMLGELDKDGRGAPMDELIRRAATEGIANTELEEITNSLMDKGLVYEPVLGRLKRI